MQDMVLSVFWGGEFLLLGERMWVTHSNLSFGLEYFGAYHFCLDDNFLMAKSQLHLI